MPNPTGWVDPLGLSCVEGGCPGDNGAPPEINANDLQLTKTVENHLNDLNRSGDRVRPYGDSRMLMQEIMAVKSPTSDPRGVPGVLRWDVEGIMNGSVGVYELVIEPEKKLVLHLLFKSVQK